MINAFTRGVRVGARTLRAHWLTFLAPLTILTAGLTVGLVAGTLANAMANPRPSLIKSDDLRLVVPTRPTESMDPIDLDTYTSNYAFLTAYRTRERLVITPDTTRYVTVQYVPSNFFSVLTANEVSQVDQLAARVKSGVAVLSAEGRARLFQARETSEALISVDDLPWQVVGTMPNGFTGASAFRPPDIWLVSDSVQFFLNRDIVLARIHDDPRIVAEQLARDLGLTSPVALQSLSEIDARYAQGVDQLVVILAVLLCTVCAVVVTQIAGLCVMIRPHREKVWRVQAQLGARRSQIFMEWLGEASVSGIAAYTVAIAAAAIALRILRALIAGAPNLRFPELILSPWVAAVGGALVMLVTAIGATTLLRIRPHALTSQRRIRWGIPSAALLLITVFLTLTGLVSMRTALGVRSELLPDISDRVIAVSLRPAAVDSEAVGERTAGEIEAALGHDVVFASPLPMFAAPSGSLTTTTGVTASGVRVIRASEGFFDGLDQPIIAGRLDAWETGSVAVVDEMLASELFGSIGASLGRTVRLEGLQYTVVAITSRTTFGIISANPPALTIIPSTPGARPEGLLVVAPRRAESADLRAINALLPSESVRYSGTYQALVLRADRLPEVSAATVSVMAVIAATMTFVVLQVGLRIAMLAAARDVAIRIAVGGTRHVAVLGALRRPLTSITTAVALACLFSAAVLPFIGAMLASPPPIGLWMVSTIVTIGCVAGALFAIVAATIPGERELFRVLQTT